jgi:hypothetical protein
VLHRLSGLTRDQGAVSSQLVLEKLSVTRSEICEFARFLGSINEQDIY